MKKLFFTLALSLITGLTFSQSQVKVNGYYRSNGTYVQPHYRTTPNNTVYDNWSTRPNVNPYTGQTGTKNYYNSNNSYNNSNYYYTKPRRSNYYNN
jgi:hypothetical protein